MKKLQSTIVALALVAGVGAVAQAQTTTPQPRAGVERSRSDSSWKGRRGIGANRMRAKGEMRGAFRGVKLTDAQKTQMKAIHQKYAPQYKPLVESMKPAMTDARTARQRGDTAAARAALAGTADTRAKLEALRVQERNEVRAILTADQQKTFDTNLAQQKERGRGRGHGKGLKKS
jgi:Spy/CpxP family protein refolding chaperone